MIAPEFIVIRNHGMTMRMCRSLFIPNFIRLWLNSGADYSLTSPSELVSLTEQKTSIHPRKLLSIYGSSYKYGSRIHDSASMPSESLGSGRNHMAGTMALHLQRASHYAVVFISLTVSTCRYFLQQNAAIEFGKLKGIPINLKVLGIGNGLTVWHSGMPQ